jgi:hypothetical protein
MAVWQFGIYFIANAVAQTHRISTGMTVSASERELITEWGNLSLPAEGLRQLRLLLPAGHSWSNDLEVLGDLESTCLTFHKENHSVISIYARFDLRIFSIEVVNAVMKFASAMDCLLLTDDNKVISPSISDLKAEIKDSSAYRFVRDPKGFIADMSKAS